MEKEGTWVLGKNENKYLRHDNKANIKQAIIISRHMYKYICKTRNKNNENVFSAMSDLETNYRLKPDFQKVDQHPGGKWLVHAPKHHKDNQLQSPELPCRIYQLRISTCSWHKGVRW